MPVPNYLYRNKHDVLSKRQALSQEWHLSGEGQELGSMGVDFGDFRSRRPLDITVTNFAEQVDDLYRNEGPGQGFANWVGVFEDGSAVYPYVKCGRRARGL